MSKNTIVTLPLAEIVIDPQLQSREEINQQTVQEYTEAIEEGVEFPPVDVYEIEEKHYLSNGFHRYEAHKRAGAKEIRCIVRTGTKRDAILHSLKANAFHGLPRNNKDKIKSVKIMLVDSEWRKKSDAWIAKSLGLSQPFVSKYRKEFAPETITEKECQDGRKMNTEKIGRKKKQDQEKSTPDNSTSNVISDSTEKSPTTPAQSNETTSPESASEEKGSSENSNQEAIPDAKMHHCSVASGIKAKPFVLGDNWREVLRNKIIFVQKLLKLPNADIATLKEPIEELYAMLNAVLNSNAPTPPTTPVDSK